MSLIEKRLKQLSVEKKASSSCPYSHLLSPSIVECSDGKLLSVIKVDGVPFDTETDDVIEGYKRSWHEAISRVNDNACIYVTTLRKKIDITLEGKFNSPFLKKFDEDYHAKFKDKSFYRNEIYIAVMVNGISESASNKKNMLDKILSGLQKTSEKAVKGAREHQREKGIKRLISTVDMMLTMLSAFKPALIGSQDENLGYSELLCYLSELINPLEKYHFQKPLFTESYQYRFNETKSRYPKMNLSQYLTATQYFFGNYILFKSASDGAQKFGAVLSIKGYPNITSPFITDKLLSCDCEFILSNAFFPIDNNIANKMVERQRDKLEAVESKAYEAINALTLLESELASEKARLGFHQMNLLILGENKSAVDKGVLSATTDYRVMSFREIGLTAFFMKVKEKWCP